MQVSVILNAPASTIPGIIGPKGATLKQVRDQTGVRIDIPRKGAAPAAASPTNGHANTPFAPASRSLPLLLQSRGTATTSR